MPRIRDEAPAPVELEISGEKVCYIITKAREYDVKVDPVESEPGSNPADDAEREVLEDFADDATAAELKEAIDDLNDDEVVDLIAMIWVGRGDFRPEEWKEAKALARERHRRHSADYLMGIPTLADFIEEGFSQLGHSCEEFEKGRL
ncbi:MAG TPA: DUF3775 domain-containing protein [Stellaceae bacterium]|nr:DUF3775 domain-containing protein [Stellaceae bacterium]